MQEWECVEEGCDGGQKANTQALNVIKQCHVAQYFGHCSVRKGSGKHISFCGVLKPK